MALTFEQIKTRLGNLIGDSDNDIDIGIYVNLAARDVYNAALWGDRGATSHQLTTATTTLTDGVVSAFGTALTSSGANISTSWAKRKIAPSIGSEYSVIDSVASASAATLASGWASTALAGSTTVYVYEDRIALPADCETVSRIVLFDDSVSYTLQERPRTFGDGLDLIPIGDGRPSFWHFDRPISGTKYVRLGPVVPDQQYALVIEYWKSYTDMVDDSDTCDVPDARIDLVMHRALWWIYQRDHFARAQACLVTYERELQRHIAMDRGSAPGAVQVGERRVEREAPDTFVDVRDLVI